MADKLKKKPSFFFTKRGNSKKTDDEPRTPTTPKPKDSPPIFKATPPDVSNNLTITGSKSRKLSASGIKDIVQCALCLEVFHNPKMLPCQHTFCMACISVYIADLQVIDCPVCNTRIQVSGSNFVKELPSNLYIDSLLQMVGIKTTSKPNSPATPPSTPVLATTAAAHSVELFAAGLKCSQCRLLCDNSDITSCAHCKLNFCRTCWSRHLDDMRKQIEAILKQLDSSAGLLEHKIEHYQDRCERILEQINITADEKINAIIESKENLLREATDVQKSGQMTALALKTSLNETRQVASQVMSEKTHAGDKDQVITYMNLHQNAVQLLSEVSKWDTEGLIFDKENFRLEAEVSTPLEAESDDPVLDATGRQNNPLETEDSLVVYYRARNFVPHYVWRKTSRPGGIGVDPWNSHLYVCSMDTHNVLVVERSQAKIVARLSCEEMLYPVRIAFMKRLGEIYVTDKWKHCIHVFSQDGEYLRTIGQKGSRPGMFRSPEGITTDNVHHHIYLADTGNDRVQVLQPDGKFVDQIGVTIKKQPMNTASVWESKELMCTEFNAPSDVAVTKDRVIVLDAGNRRVKIYNKQDKSKITEFGAQGQRKGQFNQPEALAVDPKGFILVGDSGNCRVQVFKPDGQPVRVFGGLGTQPGKFGWISGIHVTNQLDIVISDNKNRCVNFF